MQRRPRGLSANYANEDERVQELLSDKSVLALPLLSKDNWIRNDQRPHCYFCQRKFRPLVRTQHHCRGCGEVVCRACNRHRKVLTGPSQNKRARNVRLCVDCIDKATIAASKLDGADVSFRAAEGAADDNAPTPDCNFMYSSLHGSSNADTTRSSASVRSFSSSASASMASLERSASESSASSASFEWDSTTSSGHSSTSSRSRSRKLSRTGIAKEDSSSSAQAASRHLHQHPRHRHEEQEQKRRPHPIEFLPEHEQLEIYEVRRQELLALYGIVDTEPQTEYDALCELASRALQCTVAAVGFIDSTRQWYKARVGISQSELPRNIAFCSRVLQNSLPTIVMDASQDPRFNTNPLVTSSASIRFYATTPICDPGTGIVIGSVFVMDRRPKSELPPRAMEILAYLSIAAEKLLLSGTLRAKMRKQHQQQLAEAVHKRKHRVHSAPTIASVNELERPAVRAASLQCVPEELETKDDFASISHAIPRNARERELYELIDPDVLLPHSLSRRSSESELLSARGSGKFSSHSRARTIAVPPPPRAQRRMSASSVRWSEQGSAFPIGSGGDTADDAHLDLLRRISTTQELLAQQREFLATLSASPSSIGAIGDTMDHIESAMRALSAANSRLRSSNSSSSSRSRSSKRRGTDFLEEVEV